MRFGHDLGTRIPDDSVAESDRFLTLEGFPMPGRLRGSHEIELPFEADLRCDFAEPIKNDRRESRFAHGKKLEN